MNKYSVNSVSDLQSFSDPNDKRINPQLYKSGDSETSSVPAESIKWIIKYVA